VVEERPVSTTLYASTALEKGHDVVGDGLRCPSTIQDPTRRTVAIDLKRANAPEKEIDRAVPGLATVGPPRCRCRWALSAWPLRGEQGLKMRASAKAARANSRKHRTCAG
jgi:hypothetical protein